MTSMTCNACSGFVDVHADNHEEVCPGHPLNRFDVDTIVKHAILAERQRTCSLLRMAAAVSAEPILRLFSEALESDDAEEVEV